MTEMAMSGLQTQEALAKALKEQMANMNSMMHNIEVRSRACRGPFCADAALCPPTSMLADLWVG